jgi:outer membrane protein insertion porin family
MQQFLLRISFLLITALASVLTVQAQDTTKPTSVDPALIDIETSRIPKEYTIRGIDVTGIHHLDTSIVLSICGINVGDKVTIPGSDVFSKSIHNLWRQRLFSNVQIYITRVQGENIWIELSVAERPRLGSFKFVGAKKTETEDMQPKMGLTKQTIITENMLRNIVEVGTKFYQDKGFQNVRVWTTQTDDPNFSNSKIITIYVYKGSKVRIDEINFFGNENVESTKLKKQLKGTKEMSKLTLHPSSLPSPYGEKKSPSFKEYINNWGFLSLSKTKLILDPYFRFKLFTSAKFNKTKFEDDKEKIIRYYNSLGYRDAQIVADTTVADTSISKSKINVDIKVSEGRRYYFGNIAWKGNAKYSDSLLNVILGIHKGDIYNLDILNKRLGKELSQEGGDISGYYMDDGYLFFRVEAVETAVYSDTIDHEIRITEGPQARIKNVTISGNERTKDHVIRRELRTIPGELFSRSDLIRSQRELANLQYFNQETINPGVVPNAEDGTVDINWKLEEKSSDQLELSAGWGGGIGLTGTLGVTFNNFSIKNIWKKSAWDPLPTGDGQKLSLRVQSNGKAFRSYNFSFTEPWLGGKKRNSFTIGYNNSKYSNAFDQFGRIDNEKSDTTYLKVNGFSVSLGKQLKWPDDYFSLVYTISFTQYKMKNYPIFEGLKDGTSNNLSFRIALQRSSVFDPVFPRSGSNFLASVQFTPPYSLFNPDLVNSTNPYKNPEYHKWRFNAEWYVPIGRPLGAEKNRQFVLKMAAKYGFMGRYTKKLDYSPFERFQLGDAGLTNNFGLLGYDIIAHRGYPVYESSDPSINPDNQQTASRFFTIFNKYQLEMRYPLVTNPGSTIYGLAFFEAANGWYSFKEYNPFRLRRSVGVGMRFFLPMFGLLGFDYGIGLDRITPGGGLKNASKFTFMLGFEPE